MPQNHRVDINPIPAPTENQTAVFNPQALQIAASDVVFWRNNDSDAMHQPKPVDGTDDDWTDAIPTNSNSLRSPSFRDPGTYDYVCALHSGEKGTITVG